MDIIAIYGRKKLGKSTLAYKKAKEMIKGTKKKIIIFDPNMQFMVGIRAQTDSELVEALNKVQNSDELDTVVYQPFSPPYDAFNMYGKMLWKAKGFVMIWDEASTIMTANHSHDWADRFIRQGHVNKADIIMTMHRPRDTSTFTRSQLTEAYFFRTTLKHDLKAIDDICGEGVSEKVYSLRGRDVIHFTFADSDEQDDLIEEITDSREWYIDKNPDKIEAERK